VQGHLVQFECGHRGQPSRIEEKRISRLLRKSGFIPMLEDMPAFSSVKAPEVFKADPPKQGKPIGKAPAAKLISIEEDVQDELS
jgi:hypothetical protein